MAFQNACDFRVGIDPRHAIKRPGQMRREGVARGYGGIRQHIDRGVIIHDPDGVSRVYFRTHGRSSAPHGIRRAKAYAAIKPGQGSNTPGIQSHRADQQLKADHHHARAQIPRQLPRAECRQQ